MIVTIKADITWEGMPKNFATQSDKKLRRTLKDITGASDVQIIEVNAWDEEDSGTFDKNKQK